MRVEEREQDRERILKRKKEMFEFGKASFIILKMSQKLLLFKNLLRKKY